MFAAIVVSIRVQFPLATRIVPIVSTEDVSSLIYSDSLILEKLSSTFNLASKFTDLFSLQ